MYLKWFLFQNVGKRKAEKRRWQCISVWWFRSTTSYCLLTSHLKCIFIIILSSLSSNGNSSGSIFLSIFLLVKITSYIKIYVCYILWRFLCTIGCRAFFDNPSRMCHKKILKTDDIFFWYFFYLSLTCFHISFLFLPFNVFWNFIFGICWVICIAYKKTCIKWTLYYYYYFHFYFHF